MPDQSKLIVQETTDSCQSAMEDFIGHASDLELVGYGTDANNLRELAGLIEQFINVLRKRH